MATFSVNVNGTSVNFSIADADAARIMAAYADMGSIKDPKTGLVTPIKPEKVIENIANQAIDFLTKSTIRHEQAVAARAATVSVAPLVATLVKA